MMEISRGYGHLENASQSNPALEMRLIFGGTFWIFPHVIKIGFYFSWIQGTFNADQEFTVFLLDKTVKEKSPPGNLP